ncbi:hypothetical protein CCICO_04580 [Corynebacterium ciconiae DSM 44920]|uniref:HNH endonuclease family protein n=1 Tax=Corynebacterium ciconiae TaxID=227319 RepID=UPI00036A6D32|nr:HNH endonuclease family protein [Corynebacterium ciconiae]WKD60953.1 hypothetical protein CCICO_04580 [Corynebacterium ciconiae DSM 44920]
MDLSSRRGWGVLLGLSTLIWLIIGFAGRIPAHPSTEPHLPGLAETLPQVSVVKARSKHPGYQREFFGPGWRAQPELGPGCTTRDRTLRAAGVTASCERRPHGALRDLYTGETVDAATEDIQIDHIFPLAAAWDLGAAIWPSIKAEDFANDPLNIVAVSAHANQEKSDALPSVWMPPYHRHHCWYSERLAYVAARYGLALPHKDIARMKRSCWVSEVLGFSLNSQFALSFPAAHHQRVRQARLRRDVHTTQ